MMSDDVGEDWDGHVSKFNTGSRTEISCGIQVDFCRNIVAQFDSFVLKGPFRFLVTPLSQQRNDRADTQLGDDIEEPLFHSDLILDSQSWSTAVVGCISKWIDCDHTDNKARKTSCEALVAELQWAAYLSLSAVIIEVSTKTVDNLGANICRLLETTVLSRQAIWIVIPLARSNACNGSGFDETEDPWFWWNKIRVLCNYSSRLNVCLRLGESLPDEKSIQRWAAEPVSAFLIPTDVFLLNSKGYPVLTKAHQKVFAFLNGRIGARPIITGKTVYESGYNPFFLFLQHLAACAPPPSDQEDFERPFFDYLQSPLQPLGDNLESGMYETFERCPVKYRQYQEAIRLALMERDFDQVVVVMVVGAGRGPLVKCTLRAAEETGRTVTIYAVEKNPNAIVTLKSLKMEQQWDNVTIVSADMRTWQAPELADILVSELLGSWGDNELSPECLDGAERLLEPKRGVSIPYEYTSFVEPISSPKLWRMCRDFCDDKYLETMYVVKLRSYLSFSSPQEVFSFAHPSWHKGNDGKYSSEFKHEVIDNARFAELNFEAETSSMLHGFAGYFECKLWKGISISTNPSTASLGMYSWFPMYIPLRTPLFIRKGDKLKALFWRCADSSRVWYEWNLQSNSNPMPQHNANGQSYSMKKRI